MKITDSKTEAGYPLGSVMTVLGICLLCFALITVSLFFVPGLFGYEVSSVSDETPESPARSAVITSYSDPASVEKEEEIVFRTGSGCSRGAVLGTNPRDRIITVTDDSGSSETAVPYGRYVGDIKVTVPYAGNLFEFYTQPLGMINAVCFILSGILLIRIGKLLKTKPNRAEAKQRTDSME